MYSQVLVAIVSPPNIHNQRRIPSLSTMSSYRAKILLLALTCYLISHQSTSARILAQCDAAKELIRAGIQRTFISNFVCVMKTESNFNTAKKIGPGHKASYSYGIFQISSDKWCSAFRPGGICNKNCNDFLDDNIQDDIACAKTIFEMEGFKHWNKWVRSCKNNLPNVSGCIIKRTVEESFIYEAFGVADLPVSMMIKPESVEELDHVES